jgi:hypothetical protein
MSLLRFYGIERHNEGLMTFFEFCYTHPDTLEDAFSIRYGFNYHTITNLKYAWTSLKIINQFISRLDFIKDAHCGNAACLPDIDDLNVPVHYTRKQYYEDVHQILKTLQTLYAS